MAPVVLSVDLAALQTIELLVGFADRAREGKWRVPRPYSARIELALATLGATGFAEVSNPRYKSITVLDEHRAQFREHLASQFPPEVISRARQAAKQFDQALIEHPLLQERAS